MHDTIKVILNGVFVFLLKKEQNRFYFKKQTFFQPWLVLLASSEQGLQHVFDQFSVACNQPRMKIGTKKTDIMFLQKPKCMLQVSGNTLQ